MKKQILLPLFLSLNLWSNNNIKSEYFSLEQVEIKEMIIKNSQMDLEFTKKEANPILKKNKKISKDKNLYFQIGSFSKKPNDKYISTIKKKGFKTKIIKEKNYKLLIGPITKKKEELKKEITKKLGIKSMFIKSI